MEFKACVKISFIIAEKIAIKFKFFLDGEFLKDCMVSAAEILCSSEKNLFFNVSLSVSTISKHTDDMADDISSSVKEEASKFIYIQLSLTKVQIFLTC